jgi:hypothetical protein
MIRLRDDSVARWCSSEIRVSVPQRGEPARGFRPRFGGAAAACVGRGFGFSLMRIAPRHDSLCLRPGEDALAALQRRGSHFLIADANRMVDFRKENLAIPNLAGRRRINNRGHDRIDLVVGEH